MISLSHQATYPLRTQLFHYYLPSMKYFCQTNSTFPFPADEGLTPTKGEGTCLRRLSMFRKEVH